MAKAANADNVNKSRQAPDARFAVQTIRGSIKKKKDRVSGINGEIGDDWNKIEGHGINKVGARLWAALDKLEPDEREDAMRSFNMMCDVSEWPEQQADLVDSAQGKVVPMRMKTVDRESLEGAEEEIQELESEAEAQRREQEFDDADPSEKAAKPDFKD